jgi:hypothetical protein
MDIYPQVADADANNDEWGNHASVDGGTAAESSIPQRGDGPKNNCHRGSHGVNAREGLINLKYAVDDNSPLRGCGGNIVDHVPHNGWDDESADRRGNEHGDARESEGDGCSEGDPVCGGDTP